MLAAATGMESQMRSRSVAVGSASLAVGLLAPGSPAPYALPAGRQRVPRQLRFINE